MRDLLLIAVIALCSLIAIFRPVFGLLTFICLGFVNPHSMAWTTARSLPFAQLTSIGTIIGYIFWPEPKGFPRQRESFLLLTLWCMFGISTYFAFNTEAAGERLIAISKILLMIFFCTALIATKERLHWLLYIIALALGYYGFKGGLFVFATGGNSVVYGPERSFLYANNSIGLALAINVPLLVYLSKIEMRLWLRWIMRAMLVLSYPAVICTYSRGAWLSLAAATALIILKSKHKFLLVVAGLILQVTMLPFLLEHTPQRLTNRYGDLVNYQEEGSVHERYWSWEFCKRVGLANPLIGAGLDFYSTEAYAVYYPEFLERYPDKVWACHSMWYTMFAEHGVPGFVLWVGLIGSCFLSLVQIRSYGRAHPKMSWLIDYTDMLQAALLAYLVGGSFLDVAYFDLFYYLVATIIILKEIIRRSAFEASSTSSVTDIDKFVFDMEKSQVG